MTLYTNDESIGYVTPYDNAFVSFVPDYTTPEELPTLSQTLSFSARGGPSAYENTLLTFHYARAMWTTTTMFCPLNVLVDGEAVATIAVDGSMTAGAWQEQQVTLPGLVGVGTEIAFSVSCDIPPGGEVSEVWLDQITVQSFSTENCPGQQR